MCMMSMDKYEVSGKHKKNVIPTELGSGWNMNFLE